MARHDSGALVDVDTRLRLADFELSSHGDAERDGVSIGINGEVALHVDDSVVELVNLRTPLGESREEGALSREEVTRKGTSKRMNKLKYLFGRMARRCAGKSPRRRCESYSRPWMSIFQYWLL